jgi:hypothetical protein
MEPSLDVMPATAVTVIGGIEYTYGCPDWPCPVLPIVTAEIESGRFFWLPAGTFAKPAIYLTALRTPVMLRRDTKDIKPEPPTDPYLTGPEELHGAYAPPINQLVCENVDLVLHVPDYGVWDFVSGSVRTLALAETSAGWGHYGLVNTESLSTVDFRDLLEGTYDVRSAYGNIAAYEATFVATMRRMVGDKTYEAEVEHSLICGTSDYFEPEAPYLTGPEKVLGWRGHDLGLICRNFEMDLVSPDGGVWNYVWGKVILDYLRWGEDLHTWIPTGKKTVRWMNTYAWNQMLADAYEIRPKDTKAVAYRVTVKGVVERQGMNREWSYPVQHSFLCLGPDFYDGYIEAARR